MDTFLVVVSCCFGFLILLASIFLRFTSVEEGTAKAVRRFKGFRKIIMKWEGYTLAEGGLEDGNVVQGEDPWSIVGGLRFVGIRFIDEIYEYNFRWVGFELVKDKMQVVPHEKVINYIFLKPDLYVTEVKEAETRPPQRYRVSFKVLALIQSKNPYRTLFRAPSNWNENAMNLLNTEMRTWTSNCDLDDVLQFTSSKEKIWDGLPARVEVRSADGTIIIPARPAIPGFGSNALLTTTFEEWGIKVQENGIELRDIVLPPTLEKAAEAEEELMLESKGFASKTEGALIAMIAKRYGKDIKDIQKEFRETPDVAKEKYGDYIRENRDTIIRRLELESGAIRDYRVSGGQGLLALLADLFHGGSGLGGGGVKPPNGTNGGNNPGGGKRRAPWNQGLNPDQ